jgi:hypothetical protein
MPHDPTLPPDDALALASDEAAVGVLGAVIGASTLGPEGAVVAALLGPFAVHAARRLREFMADVRFDELEIDQVAKRLFQDEQLADLVAQALHAAIESDLKAKRRLLARAVRHALADDAQVDVEAKYVRTAAVIDTTDIRVLAIVNAFTQEQRMPIRHIGHVSPGVGTVGTPALAALTSAGLVSTSASASGQSPSTKLVRISDFGSEFMARLITEGLWDEMNVPELPDDTD